MLENVEIREILESLEHVQIPEHVEILDVLGIPETPRQAKECRSRL